MPENLAICPNGFSVYCYRTIACVPSGAKRGLIGDGEWRMEAGAKPILENFKPPVKLKLSALWASVMFLYVYGDYFMMYTPRKLASMAAGDLGIGPATETALLGVSIMMAIPSAMVFLALALPPLVSRWLNVVLGLAYAIIVALTMPGAPLFYLFIGALDVALTLLIAWYALSWPKRVGADQ